MNTGVELEFTQGFTPYSPYSQDTFTGKVKAKKGCKRKRTIKIQQRSVPSLDLISVLGTTTSNGEGAFALGTDTPVGTYTARAKKRKRTSANGTKIICKKGTSAPLTVSF